MHMHTRAHTHRVSPPPKSCTCFTMSKSITFHVFKKKRIHVEYMNHKQETKQKNKRKTPQKKILMEGLMPLNVFI